MSDLHTLDAPALADAFASKSLSPVTVTQALLDRIAALDGKTNAFCLIDADTALAQARASEARWMKGEGLSRLDGVPVAIKDLLWTKGWPTLRGSRTIDPNQAWDADAPAVTRLREAGAVLLGKTTTPEYGWKGVTDGPLTGVTRNPWNLEMTPGGSSGGSAAALAARLAPLAIGTDGGGSIRIPASFSSVFGLKPTYGHVPAFPPSPFGTLAHLGPMSRDVDGGAMLLDVICGFDPRDPHAVPVSVFAPAPPDLKGRRIAFSPALGFAKVDDEVAALVAAAAKSFAEMGAIVEQVDPPGGDTKDLFRTLWWSGAAYLLGRMPEAKKALLDPGLARMVEEGAAIGGHDVIAANSARAAYASAMRVFFQSHDLLLTPAVAVPSFKAGEISPLADDGFAWLGWTPFSLPFNLTQQPAASVPCGFTRAGLPVGLQIVGRLYEDNAVLAAARAYEAAHPWHRMAPPGFSG